MFENPCIPAKWLDSGDHKMARLKRSLQAQVARFKRSVSGSIRVSVTGEGGCKPKPQKIPSEQLGAIKSRPRLVLRVVVANHHTTLMSEAIQCVPCPGILLIRRSTEVGAHKIGHRY